jgi:type I restriction enzyme S subunit
VPYEVPESWEWTTIGEIASSILYGVSESAKEIGQYKLLRITDIQNNKVNWETVPFTDYDKNKAQAYLLTDGDILFARTGATVGKSYLVEGLKDSAIYASYLIRVQTSSVILPAYIKFFLESGFYWEQISLNSVGIGQPNVNGTTLAALTIPIPPYREQLRIVEEAKKWLMVIDGLDVEIEDLQTSIEHTKSKILDLAIHGKLVPQDPNDEPAIDQLKRINPKFAPCDNAHDTNQLPNSWCWTTLGSLFQHNTGKALNKSDSQEGLLKPYLTTSNVYWNCFDFSEVKEMFFKDSELEKCTIIKGDLLVCEGGDIGRAAIWNYDYGICIQNHIHRLRAKGDVCQILYLYVLMLYKWTDKIHGKGIGLQGLSSGLLDKLVVPLPPYNEQLRIVAKIEELFAVLDEIQKSIEA